MKDEPIIAMGKTASELLEMGVAWFHVEQWIRDKMSNQFNEDMLKMIWGGFPCDINSIKVFTGIQIVDLEKLK